MQCTALVVATVEYIVIEDTPQWLYETLSDLYAYYPDADTCAYRFQSDSVTSQNIMLTEVLRPISQDLS